MISELQKDSPITLAEFLSQGVDVEELLAEDEIESVLIDSDDLLSTGLNELYSYLGFAEQYELAPEIRCNEIEDVYELIILDGKKHKRFLAGKYADFSDAVYNIPGTLFGYIEINYAKK